jgi:hypothetical protein
MNLIPLALEYRRVKQSEQAQSLNNRPALGQDQQEATGAETNTQEH